MNCNQYKKFQLGKISEKEFLDHEKDCAHCHSLYQRDQEIMSVARKLNTPLEAGQLWHRIETALRQESRSDTRAVKTLLGNRVFPKYIPLLTAAALFLAVFLLVLFLWKGPSTGSPGLLSRQALTRVEKSEKAYIEAIAELEQQADSRLAVMDLELSFLYRDRLEIIDEQIRHCREVITANPANTQVRRYMLAALKDKQETLKEILAIRSG